MTAAKKTPPALDLPPLEPPARPASKVESGLAAADKGAEPTQDERDAAAVAAMVAAGLTEDQARAALALAREEPAAVVEAVSDAPLCKHGCHGQGWADVRDDLDAVSCEHGSFPRRPQE